MTGALIRLDERDRDPTRQGRVRADSDSTLNTRSRQCTYLLFLGRSVSLDYLLDHSVRRLLQSCHRHILLAQISRNICY